MSALVDYSSESEINTKPHKIRITSKPLLVEATPNVDVSAIELQQLELSSKILNEIYTKQIPFINKKHLTGEVEAHQMNHFVFDEQFANFNTYGFAVDPQDTTQRVVVDKEKLPKLGALMENGFEFDCTDKEFLCKTAMGLSQAEDKDKTAELKLKRHRQGEANSGQFLGPWAGYEDDKFDQIQQLTEEQQKMLEFNERRRKEKLKEQKEEKIFEPYSEFHGQYLFDYQGRSYLEPASDYKKVEHTCYIPKKCTHTWSGHNKAVQVVRFFPQFGHLMLSGSIDNKIKLWDVLTHKQCLRTYYGHTEGIRDLCFSNDGRHFLSCSYDKSIHYWDTEYGKVITSVKLKKYPYVVKLNPDSNRQHQFLVGSTNRKIGQYDLRSGQRVQQYNEHLAAINTITFFDNNKKFVSSADDKKLFVWEYGIPVVVKYISEPEMHAINATALHPNQHYWIGQSSDNKIVVYDTRAGNFRVNRKKKFIGHQCAGYQCGIACSPDGQFLASGDAEGRVFFWDWKSMRNYRTLQAHDGVVVGVEWHPVEPSKFVTCGWDGLIKLWD